MPSKKRNTNESSSGVAPRGLSRRDFVKNAAAGAGGIAFAGRISTAFAQAADVIKIGFISPRSGPLGGFGEGDPFVLGLARKALANGLTSGGKKYKVEIVDQVSDACEAAGVPCISTVMPWEAWYFGRGAKPGEPSPFKWTYHFSFGVAEFTKAYISEWNNGAVPTNKKVGVMFPNDADGNALREHMIPIFEKAGFTVFDPGGYEDGTTDYSAQIAKYKAAGVQIFTGVPIPPDFATFWRQAAQQGLAKTIKIQSIAKTGLFPSQMEALGTLAYNIASLCYWHPTFPYKSPLTGGTSKELADGYEKSSGKQWNQQLGATQSLLDAGTELLKATDPKNKADVAKTLSHFKVTTAIGVVEWGKFPIANVFPTPLIGAQWIKAKPGSKYKLDLVVVDNADDPNVPVGAKLQPYS